MNSNENLEAENSDVLVIDYGVGNILSVLNALDFLGYKYKVSNKKEDIINSPAYILPGVGAFNQAMENLNKLEIIKTLENEILVKKKPILGICLGMQILADSSNENGYHEGLGWIKGNVVKMEASQKVRVPHVGWNDLSIKKENFLFKDTTSKPHFYFDHSFHFKCEKEFICATCSNGGEIIAAVQKENIYGVQFHPEKSQRNGLKMFRNFFNHIQKKC
jgi:imidazole glycerol-phosphate synthase subunit HisH